MPQMTNVSASLHGVLLDEVALTLEELARACEVEPDWVVRRVHAGILGGQPGLENHVQGEVQLSAWRFRSGDLLRARHLLRVERDFDANEDLAALVVDLTDEVRRLRARLHVLGID
jgi:chaperone modulatory protein CbpM